MEFLIALVVAGVVTAVVVQDARTLRDEEIAVLGSSTVSPGLWGTGVFLLMFIFLPAYIFMRITHNQGLTEARMRGARSSASARTQAPLHAEEVDAARDLLEEGAVAKRLPENLKGQYRAWLSRGEDGYLQTFLQSLERAFRDGALSPADVSTVEGAFYVAADRPSFKRLMARVRAGEFGASDGVGASPSVAHGPRLDELAKAHELLEKGAVTQEEYETIKADLIGREAG